MSKIGDFLKGIGSSITGNGLLSLGGSLASLFGGNRNIDKQIKAQASENQKNRDYNLMLAKLQNQWNQEQWERENDYNSPESQMARFKEAGLNPDLIYGQGSNGNSFQMSGGMTSGSPSSPQDFTALGQKMTVGEAIRSSLDMEMQQAQIDAIRANAQKTRSETEGQQYTNDILKSDAKFRDAINQGSIDLSNVSINQINSNIAKNDVEINKIKTECSKLAREVDLVAENAKLVRSKIANVKEDTIYKQLENAVHGKRNQAYIESLMAHANLSRKSAMRLTYLLGAEYLNLKSAAQKNQADIELMQKVGINYDAETERLQVDTQFAKDDHTFNKAMRVVDAVVNGVSAVVTGIGTIYGVGTIGKALAPKPVSTPTGSVGYPYN